MGNFTLRNPAAPQQPPEAEPEVDPVALEAFAAGARERRGANEEPPPWEQHNPAAVSKYNVTIRMNEHQLAMLRYLTEVQETSQSKFLQKLVLPMIKPMAEEAFEKSKGR